MSKKNDANLGGVKRKKGRVNLYFDGDLIRTKDYDGPKERKHIIKKWTEEARRITSDTVIEIGINPEL